MQHASKTQQRRLRTLPKQALERQFSVDSNPPFQEVLALLCETADFKSFSMSDCLQRMPAWWSAVCLRGLGRAYLLRDGQGRAASAVIMVNDSRCAYYLAGGIRHDLRQGFPFNVMLFHRMIHDAHQRGLDFDFEGSILPGVERFFRELGGELHPVYRVVKFRSPIAYAVWCGYRYLTRHCKRKWVRYE